MARGGEVGESRAVAAFAASASARWLFAAQRGAIGPSGGGTGITAAVLGILGSLYMVLMTANGVWLLIINARWTATYWSSGAFSDTPFGTPAVAILVVQVLFALASLIACVLLALGGTQLLRRSARGAKLLMAGSGVTLGWVALGGFWAVYAMVEDDLLLTSPVLVLALVTLCVVPFALATLVLAMLPSTRRWVEAGK